MLNFNTTLEEVISTQTNGRTNNGQFTEYNSKKKLIGSNLYSETVNNYIGQLKNTFTFYVHNGLKYIVLTMYYSTTKTYGFYVLDTETLQVAEVQSVKTGKKEVLEILAANK